MTDARLRLFCNRAGWLLAIANVLLAGAANEGCSGTVITGGSTTNSTTTSTSTSTSTAPSCTCSASTPAAGATCDDTACADVLCYYDNGCGQMNEWHCKEGIWQINTGSGCP